MDGLARAKMQEIIGSWVDSHEAFTYPATVKWHGLRPPFAPAMNAGFHRQVRRGCKALSYLLNRLIKRRPFVQIVRKEPERT
jgi:hypothetical protein